MSAVCMRVLRLAIARATVAHAMNSSPVAMCQQWWPDSVQACRRCTRASVRALLAEDPFTGSAIFAPHGHSDLAIIYSPD